MYNPNWNRWIRASVNRHFALLLATYNPLIEGIKRTDLSSQNICEVRMDGPYTQEISRNVFDITIEVNVLIQTAMTRSSNLYRHEKTLGAVTAAFTTISIMKLGDESGDDSSVIGCLTRKDSPQYPLRTSDFGQIEADVLIRQATVEARYNVTLP